MRQLRIAVQNVAGWLDLGAIVSALRCGAEGILNLEAVREPKRALEAARRVAEAWPGGFAVKLEAGRDGSPELLRQLPAGIRTVVVVPGTPLQTAALVQLAVETGRACHLEVVSADEAELGVSLGVSALIAKGHEAGGRVGEEGSFVLLQRLLAETKLPIWVQGGIGPNTAAACLAAGAEGVVLDNQLLLTPESTLPASVRSALVQMNGEETVAPGAEQAAIFRFFRRPGMTAADSLLKLAASAGADEWRQALSTSISWTEPDTAVWPLGQDAVLAAPLALRYFNIAGIVNGLRASARAGVDSASLLTPLKPSSALAVSHQLTYPIFQGPMTRVSDVAEFAGAVASNGALPFLALALLRAPEVRSLLESTSRKLAGQSWGVGILGFVEPELRAEQLEVVRSVKPPFAIIAGGRPDQAMALEEIGIRAYLHIPAPSLLRMFIQDGARRFVFEGRECGGHVGPRTSFVLWEAMIAVLLEAIASGTPAGELHAAFAGGIHDARSAAMVSALAAPLAEKGVQIAVLMGTAYLFTQEAVASGAIVEGFQRAALECRDTVSLESGPGHVTRCAATPFSEAFLAAKRRLAAQGEDVAAIKDELEKLNLGRLRVAAKGVLRENDPAGGAPLYRTASAAEQLEQGMYMIGQVAALRREVCSMRELHESISTGSAQILREAAPVTSGAAVAASAARPVEAEPLDIAIVGMSCLLPGAPDLRTFWRNILARKDAITEIPATRFPAGLYFDQDKAARDKVYSRWGGFLDPVAFDPIRLGIPPAALNSIDPLQLLSLLAAERALEDAGYGPQREFHREKASVILGLSGGLGDLGIDLALRSNLPQYLKNAPAELYDRLPEWTEDSFAGILLNVAAGRIANRLNLGGVNLAVDAACASAMAAVYVAARELRSGSSDMVVVGGCDTVQSPFGFLCFSKSQALSPTGRCRPFDSSADGIAISEGVAMLVLKRLADAERAGDRIYAVLQGVGGSSDGRGRSMTAPRREGQVSAIRRAYSQAGFSATGVGLIEAHGTGTVAGDETETASLTEVFAGDGAMAQSCVVGSVKSMVGHTKAAAGVTGLVKVALALHHRVLPPTLHVDNPNPKLREESTPFHVLTQAHPWPQPRDARPRRAGVSSFGFGGTNFHAALEEYRGDLRSAEDRCSARDWPAELFLWRASGLPALEAQLAPLAEQLAGSAEPPLAELAAAVNRRATIAGPCRLAVVARTKSELAARVESVRQAIGRGETALKDPASSIVLAANAPADLPLALLFPGQGSQFPGMLRELALHIPEFIGQLSRADDLLDEGPGTRRLSSYVFPPPSFSEADKKRRMAEITRTTIAQPALAAVEIALFRALERFGLATAMAAGHSFGEYVALAAAGVMSEDDLFRIAAARGRAIESATQQQQGGRDAGTMAAVSAGADAVSQVLEPGCGVVIANLNSPRQTIIAGPTGAIKQATLQLEGAGLTVQQIPVACAFHSPLMAPAAGELAAALDTLELSPAKRRVFSNTTAKEYPVAIGEIRKLLAQHLVEPVLFTDQILAMHAAGARVFVEVGPKSVLSNLTRQILAGQDATILASDSGDRGMEGFLSLLAQLFTLGANLRPDELCRGRVTQVPSVEALCEAPKPANWFVNGARAYPATKPYVSLPPIEMQAPQAAPAPALAPAPAVMPAPVRLAPAAPSANHPDAAMLQYQQLMAQFLQSQSAVMTAYLSGGTTPLPAAAPAPVAIDAHPPVASTTEAQVPASLVGLHAAVKSGEAVPAAGPLDQKAALLRIACERTAYPLDLLDLNAGIEADLGIDSIKRVEILSAFQRQLPASLQPAMKASMEKLTRARSLNELIALLPNAAPPPLVEVAAPSPVALDGKAALLRIASDRTGYPLDLLDLNAGIEADLGIDSIKRVEILSAFQRQLPASLQPAMKASMEKLTRARSLNELIALLPSSAPPAMDLAVDGKALLLRITSERTGYPLDLLDLTAALEADLGIDSIKRVEILTAVQRQLPASLQPAMKASMEKLTRARSLNELIALLPSSSLPEAPATPAVPRFRLAIQELPALAAPPLFHPGRVVVITDDESGLATRLAASLDRGGERAVVLQHGLEPVEPTLSHVVADLTDPQSVENALETVRRLRGPVGAVIHLLPLRRDLQSLDSAQPLEQWRAQVRVAVRSLYLLTRSAQSDLETVGLSGGALLAAVTARGGDFAIGRAGGASPLQQMTADFVKTAALELPAIACKVVDLDATDPLPILHQKLLDEITSAPGTVQIGRPGDRRLTVTPQFAGIQETKPVIGRDSVVVLTGGARGITSQVARLLAQRQPVLVLVGGSALPEAEEAADTAGITEAAALKAVILSKLRTSGANVRAIDVEHALQRLLRDREIIRTLADLRAAGARVEYHAADVRDESAMTALLNGIYQRYGRLDVFIHGAGIIEDKLIRDKTPESFDRVVHTKADSTFLLAQQLRPDSLKSLILMSSITAVFGNRGQADYAAANGLLNGIATMLSARWPGRVVAMCWGPWDQGGMVTDEVRRQFRERGIPMIPPEGGAAAVLHEIESTATADAIVALGDGPWSAAALPDGFIQKVQAAVAL